MEVRKSVLIIEDDMGMLDAYRCMLRGTYDVTFVLHNETKIPEKKYDRAIFDGLDNKWENVGEQINADKKILASANHSYNERASNIGWSVLNKPFRMNKLLEMLE